MELAEGHAALYASLDRLPHVQARHVYAHYILGRSKTGIARAENVTENAARDSISRSIGGQIMAQTRPSYHKEVKTASFQGRMITVENLTPFSPQGAGQAQAGDRDGVLFRVPQVHSGPRGNALTG